MTITTQKATELVYTALKDIAARNKYHLALRVTKAQGLARFGAIEPIVLSDRVGVTIDPLRCASYLTVYDIVVDVWDLHNNPTTDPGSRCGLDELKKRFAKTLRSETRLRDKDLFGRRVGKDSGVYSRG